MVRIRKDGLFNHWRYLEIYLFLRNFLSVSSLKKKKMPADRTSFSAD